MPKPASSKQQQHIRLRPMQAADLEQVYSLESICQPYPWPLWIFRKVLRRGDSCWVVETENRIIGFGIVSIVKNMAHIMSMCVVPEYRSMGLGRRIMQHLLSEARHHHAKYAWLEVRRTNHNAILLYRKLGFRQRQIRRNYYLTHRGREDGVTMVARLKNRSRTWPPLYKDGTNLES